MTNRMTRPKRPWDTVEYQRIVHASYDGVGNVVAEFADGGRVSVPTPLLLGDDDVNPDWSSVRAEEFHVVVPSPSGDVEIPWDIIRIHSDPEFDAHWASVVGPPVTKGLIA